MSDRDLAIVGMSCVLPGADSLNQYWSNLVNGVDAVVPIPPDRWQEVANFDVAPDHPAHLSTNRGGFLPSGLQFDAMKFGVVPNTIRRGDAYQFLMLQLIDDALRDAGIADDSPLRERADVIVGMGGYGNKTVTELTVGCEILEYVLELIDRKFPDTMAGGRRAEIENFIRSTLSTADADTVASAIPNIVTSRTANRLDLRGTAFSVDAACASSLIALEHGALRLRNNECDVAVIGGLFMTQTPTFWHVFDTLGALSPTGTLRPFDTRADGLVVGEGGGVVIVKRAADAVRDGDRVYALVKGVASASDGMGVGVMAPNSRGQVLALERAYHNAGVDPDSIGYLEAHGTATTVGDLVETTTIKEFYGTSSTYPARRGMGSVKSMIGHTMPAAGIASLIKVALALSNKLIPGTLHCEQPRPELADAPFYLMSQTRPWIHDGATLPRRAGINAFGFGGINAHVVLEEVPQPAPRRRKRQLAPRPIRTGLVRETELLAFAAESPEELSRQLTRVQQFLRADGTQRTLADVAYTLGGEVDLKKPCKLALLCEDLQDLETSLAECQQRLDRGETQWPDDEHVYFSADAAQPRGKVVCVFPGMAFPGLAGNYPDHLLELCQHFPELRAEFDRFEARDRHPEDDVPTSVIFSPPPSIPEQERKRLKARLSLPRTDRELPESMVPQERYLAGMGVTLANWMSWVLVQKLGLEPDMMTGQSQGEMMAISASGITDFHKASPFIWKVLNIDPEFKQGESMAFVLMGAEEMQPLLADYPDVHIAIHTTPSAIIIGGPRESLDEIEEKLRPRQVVVQMLPYPPIHTPHYTQMRQKFIDVLDGENVTIKKANVELYSSLTTEKYPNDRDKIRELMLKNLDHPVLLWQTIHKLYDLGGRIFVQAGGGHFASHVVTLLEGSPDLVTTAVDVDTRNPLTQLNHLAATLFTAGTNVAFDALFEYREVNLVDFEQTESAAASATTIPFRLDWNVLTHENVPPKNAPRHAASHNNGSAGSDRGAQRGAIEDVSHEVPETASAASNSGSAMPFTGRILHLEDGESLVMERTLDLEEDIFLVDHLFVHAPGVKSHAECMPILPMTCSLELLAEAAALLSPGLGLIGYEDIRASRWISMDRVETLDLHVEAKTLSVDEQTGVKRVEVVVSSDDQRNISGTVLFAEEYRADLDIDIYDATDDGPWPIDEKQLYEERFAFHGPRFQTVARFKNFGNPYFSADLKILPQDDLFRSTREPQFLTDPCLNDGIGQVLGLWCQMHDWYVLPTGVEKLELYGTRPEVGTIVPVRYEVTEFNADHRQFKVNIVVEDGSGGLWMRVQGWSDWLFRWPKQYGEWLKYPIRCYVADEIQLPGAPDGAVCTYITRAYLQNADLNRTAGVLLHSDERQEFDDVTDRKARWQYMCSRFALKDAARRFITRDTGRPVHPAELLTGHTAAGRPVFGVPDGCPNPHVSVAHSERAAVAMAADVEVGIDLEPIDRDTVSILHDFATPDEIDLIASAAEQQPHGAWATRLWCAKEAVGKVMGTGLQGRPKDFVAVDLSLDGNMLIDHQPSGRRYVVRSVQIDQFIAAYTSADALVADPVSVN